MGSENQSKTQSVLGVATHTVASSHTDPHAQPYRLGSGTLVYGASTSPSVDSLQGQCSGFGVNANELIFGDSSSPVDYTTYTFRSPLCAQGGHVMIAETIQRDGEIVGRCERCGDVMRGRREPGGLVLEVLEDIVVELADGVVDSDDLAMEILKAEEKLASEREKLDRADAVLKLAKALLVR